jgi:hypothetical protein
MIGSPIPANWTAHNLIQSYGRGCPKLDLLTKNQFAKELLSGLQIEYNHVAIHNVRQRERRQLG